MKRKSKTIDQKIDDLAAMVARGFENLATKDELQNGLRGLEERLTKRLDRIEFFVTGHERRIEILEDRVRQLAVRAGYKFR